MIAAREIAFEGSGKKWVNPYITDGLVAMWDGEWNAGGGKHDANATVWKDLVGGVVAEPVNFKNSADFSFGWGDVFCEVKHCNLTLSAPYITEVMNLPQCTFEFALTRTDGTKRMYFLGGSWQNDVHSFYLFKGKNNVRTEIHGAYRFLVGKHQSLSASFDDGQRTLFVNGVKAKEELVTETTSQEITQLFGSVYLYDDFTTCADINFARFYSRALSAEEIAANYEIDKARFGL
jgi:hypothetical protein